MSALEMLWPFTTAMPSSVMLPAPSRFDSTRPRNASPSTSTKPKSASVSVRATSSLVVMVRLAPAGASLTSVTCTADVRTALPRAPSPTVHDRVRVTPTDSGWSPTNR